jgi:TRAP-type uncharacterized transport system substrate-binding protein
MIVRRIARYPYRGWGLAALAVSAFALSAVALVQWRHSAATARASITAGTDEGLRGNALRKFVGHAAAYRVDLHVVNTSGSAEAIEEVDAGSIDFALVLGGVDFTRYKNIRQVTSMHVLPLQFLVKEELADAVTAHLGALRGKVIDLGGGLGTGTYWLAREVLAFVGLHPGSDGVHGDYVVSTLSPAQFAEQSDRAHLPDALFLVANIPSPVVRDLIVRGRYRLVALPFRDAFALGAMFETDHPALRPHPVGAHDLLVQKEHVVDTIIPAYTYQADPSVPAEPLHTLGMTALLIANRRVDPDVVGRLLDTLFQSRYARLSQPRLDFRRLEEIPEMPWHPGAIAYLRRSKPILTGEALSALVNVFSIAGPIAAGFLFVLQWFRQRSRFGRERSFEAYIAKVSELERRVLEPDDDAPLDHAAIDRLGRELGRLKSEALMRFAQGEMEGEAMITGFLVHVNDVRAHLAHLARRRRDGIAEAHPQQTSPP